MLTDRLWCEILDDDPIDQSRFFSSKTHDTPSQFLHMVAQVCPPYKILSEREIIKNLVWFHALTISEICAKAHNLLIPKQGIRNFFIFSFWEGGQRGGHFYIHYERCIWSVSHLLNRSLSLYSLASVPWKMNTTPRHHRVRATMSKWKKIGQSSLRRQHGKIMVLSSG